MPQSTHQQQMHLGIHRIEPLNLSDPMVQSALEQTRRALKNPRLRDILTVRTHIQKYLSNRLIRDGYVHPPIYMLAGCTDPLNHWTYPARLNYYGAETSVTQSLILQKILMVMMSPLEKVFWASPNIRMEMRISRREYKYSTEFMQIDFEKRDGTFDEMLKYLDHIGRALFDHLNRECAEQFKKIRGELLPAMDYPLKTFDATQIMKKEGLSSHDEVERFLSSESEGKPFILVNMKREAYDCFDDDSGKYLNFDLIVPPTKANTNPVECLSGAERTRSIPDLADRMHELDYPMDYFAPFFELYHSINNGNDKIACAGGGFGVERLTYALLGLEDIHEVYPFPRLAEGRIAM